MMILSFTLFGLAVVGVVLVAIQLVALTQHLDADPVEGQRQPAISSSRCAADTRVGSRLDAAERRRRRESIVGHDVRLN